MIPRTLLDTVVRPIGALLGERVGPAPTLAGVAPPLPLFGARPEPEAAHSERAGPDPGSSAVGLAHELALGFAQLESSRRAVLARKLTDPLRRVARSARTSPPRAALAFRPALALAWGGRIFVGEEPREWTEKALGQLSAGLMRQVAPDGFLAGTGVRDHLAALSDALECRALLAGLREARAADATLERMLETAASLGAPGRRAVDLPGAPQCLAAWKRLTGRRPRPQASFALEASGLFGVRGERSLVLIDGGGAGRERALGFEWTVDGRPIVVDEGAESREQKLEGELVLDGCEHGRRVRPRVQRTRLERFGRTLVFEAVHHGYAGLSGRPLHHRRVTASAEGLTVEDYVEGGDGHRVRAQVVLHPNVEVRRRGSSLVLVTGPVTALVETRHPVEVEPAWWRGEDGEWRRTRRLVLRYRAAPCSGSFRLERLVPSSALTSFLRRESLAQDRLGAQARVEA